ncbi:MAG TPA: hypothetical protein VNI01_06955 [Elusimicrobiota bacterium]|jgi:hypothetical protein|nr:hypothetical protein [Elusimicrobiota bacterium]
MKTTLAILSTALLAPAAALALGAAPLAPLGQSRVQLDQDRMDLELDKTAVHYACAGPKDKNSVCQMARAQVRAAQRKLLADQGRLEKSGARLARPRRELRDAVAQGALRTAQAKARAESDLEFIDRLLDSR